MRSRPNFAVTLIYSDYLKLHMVFAVLPRYVDLTAVKTWMLIFRVVMSCGLVGRHNVLKECDCPSLQHASAYSPADKGIILLQILVRNYKTTWSYNLEH